VIFELPQTPKESTIIITDIWGKHNLSLDITPQQTQAIWDCSKTATGVYFYQSEINGVLYRGKIVVQ